MNTVALFVFWLVVAGSTPGPILKVPYVDTDKDVCEAQRLLAIAQIRRLVATIPLRPGAMLATVIGNCDPVTEFPPIEIVNPTTKGEQNQ